MSVSQSIAYKRRIGYVPEEPMVEKVCSRAVILSAGRLVAEHCVSNERGVQADSLEQLFARVTAQEDYTPIARRILDVMQHA